MARERRGKADNRREASASPFYGQDILSVSQFTREKLEYIFGVAEQMREIVRRTGSTDLLRGKVLACLFYEPSTRTSSSLMVKRSSRAWVGCSPTPSPALMMGFLA